MSAKQVNDLIAFLLGKIIKLDILINNAAQTIVRIKEFYTFELNNERLQLANPPPADSLQLIENHE